MSNLHASRPDATITSMLIIIVIMVTVSTMVSYYTINYPSGANAASTTIGPTSSPSSSSSAIASSSIQVSSSALSPPTIDGQAESLPGYCQPSITTSKANDVLILFVGAQGSGPLVSVTDTAGLAWHHRASAPYNYTSVVETLEEWYTVSASPLSKDNITIKTTTAGLFHCYVLGLAGANAASPFDTSAGCTSNTAVPQNAESSTPTTNATVTICTSDRSDFLVTSLWAAGNAISSIPTGFTFLAGGGLNSFNEAYEQVSTKQTNLPVTWTFGGDSWGMIGDAIASGSP